MSDQPGTEIPDEVLCQRIAGRDDTAFDLLVARWQGRTYRLAWSILRDVEDARDLSQEAFVRLYETAASFQGRARFSTWFYRILVNLCLDHRRRRVGWRRLLVTDTAGGGDEPDTPLVERQPGETGDPADAVDQERMMARLWEAVHRLSPQQRAAILLQVQEDLSTPEIAEVLRCSEATVRVHLHRAVTALRARVGRR